MRQKLENEIELPLNRIAMVSIDLQQLKQELNKEGVSPGSVPETVGGRLAGTPERLIVLTPEARERLERLALGNEGARELARRASRLCHSDHLPGGSPGPQ